MSVHPFDGRLFGASLLDARLFEYKQSNVWKVSSAKFSLKFSILGESFEGNLKESFLEKSSQEIPARNGFRKVSRKICRKVL